MTALREAPDGSTTTNAIVERIMADKDLKPVAGPTIRKITTIALRALGKKGIVTKIDGETGLSSRLKRRCRRHHREPRTGKAPDGAEEFADHRIGMANMQASLRRFLHVTTIALFEADSEGNLIF